jgi:hypothetical protein
MMALKNKKFRINKNKVQVKMKKKKNNSNNTKSIMNLYNKLKKIESLL